MTERDQGEQPKALFDTLIDSAIAKFRAKEFYSGEHHKDQKFAYHLPCAIADAIEEIGDPIIVFKEVIKDGNLRIPDIERHRVTLERASEGSWEEYLDEVSGIILEGEIGRRFPELVIESERRWLKYEEEDSTIF